MVSSHLIQNTNQNPTCLLGLSKPSVTWPRDRRSPISCYPLPLLQVCRLLWFLEDATQTPASYPFCLENSSCSQPHGSPADCLQANIQRSSSQEGCPWASDLKFRHSLGHATDTFCMPPLLYVFSPSTYL